MSITTLIGEHTISRLERAAEKRFEEADFLVEGKHGLTAVYLFGYVAEIVLGAAFFRLRGYGKTDEITQSVLRKAINEAMHLSRMPDKSHPIDGWAARLIEERKSDFPPPFAPKLEELIQRNADVIGENWGPKLRYRTLKVTEKQVRTVRSAAGWFLRNYPKL